MRAAKWFMVVAACFFMSTFAIAATPGIANNIAKDHGRKECKNCHQEEIKPRRYDPAQSWLKSRHAAAGVTCTKCHLKQGVEGNEFYKTVTSKKKEDAHANLLESPAAIENRTYFVEICGSCHKEKYDEFKASVHGEARLESGRGVSCIDCHNPHRAAQVSNVDSRLYRGADLHTCGRCHNEMLGSYMKTFHGKQFALGNNLVPTCAYCHIGHEVPLDNPDSVLHMARVGNLCAGCHGDAVAKGFGADAKMIHNLSKDSTRKVIHFRDPVKIGPFSIASFINSSYIAMIIGVVGFFTLLSTRDFIKKTKDGHLSTGRKNGKKKRGVKRFSIFWRMQHFFWAFSFIVLAATGLSLKFPDNTLSGIILWIVGGPAMRSLVHRVAALVFLATAVVHIIPYVFRLKSPDKMLLTKKDFLDALLHISYLFDRTDKMPLMDRYAWHQKLEYWATVLGACIIAATGILMWGFAPLVKTIPLALIYYAQMIHGWEAILAVLVIIVQHFYHTFLNPLVFPMDWSWITGRTNYELMEHDHPLELMEIEEKKGDSFGSDQP